MKKLFALVLTLALVFAIAAPAMAASWGAPEATTGVPYATTVTLLQANTDAAGNTYYTAYPANLGVVAGTSVLFQVSFTVPTAAEVAAYYGSLNPSEAALVAKISYKNLKSVALTTKGNTDGIASIDADGVITVDKSKLVYTADQDTYTAMFSAVVSKTAEASITSTYGYGAAATVASFTNIVKKVSGVDYTITATGISSSAGSLALTLGTGSLVTGMTLTIPGTPAVTYTVAAGPVFQYIDNSAIKTLATDAPNYAAVLAVYNALTGVLGFKAGDAGVYYTTANIIANFSVKNAATDTKTYKPYTSSLTVSDSTTVPNTGDAVSVLGFVMVGLALLATAAVVVKKVRA